MPWKIKIHERLKVLLWRIVVGATRKHRCSAGAAAPAPDAHWCGDAADMHPCHFFFLLGADSRRFVTNRADSSGNGRYSPILAKTGCHHVAGLHSSASWGLVWEREREIRVFASCALTWNYDRECKVESCGVYRFLNRCIGIRENLLKQ